VLSLLHDVERCQSLADAGRARIDTYDQLHAAREFETQLIDAWLASRDTRGSSGGSWAHRRSRRRHAVSA
jgi:hypothetical protein